MLNGVGDLAAADTQGLGTQYFPFLSPPDLSD